MTEDIVDGVPAGASSSRIDSSPPPYAASIAAPLLPRATSSRLLESHAAFNHPQASATGLPSGYFLLRSRAAGNRTFDLLGHRQDDGAEIGLHPVKEPVLRAGSRTLQIPQNNQVLYLDYNGHLNSACASRPIDASLEDGLTLAITHPIMPIPSRHSHPLPTFRLDPTLGTLHVLFAADPTYPGPSTSTTWQDDYDYIVEAVPSKRSHEEASVWTAASDGLATALGGLSTLGDGALATLGGFGDKLGGLGLFSKSTPASPNLEDGPPPPPPPPKAPRDSNRYPAMRSAVASPAPLASSSFPPRSPNPDAPLPSLPPGDPYDSDESDSDPSAYRPLRIVRLPRSTWREKIPSEVLSSRGFGSPQLGLAAASSKEVRKWRRRQFEVVPIVIKAKTVDNSPSLGSLFTSRAPAARPLPPTSSTINESHAAASSPSRWSSSLASSAGGLVSSISGTLRTPILTATGRGGPRQDDEDDVRGLYEQSTAAVGDEDAMALASGDLERLGRTSGERRRAAGARSRPESSLQEELGSDADSSTPSLVAIPLTPAPGPSAFPEPTEPTSSVESRDAAQAIERQTPSADLTKPAEGAESEQEKMEGEKRANEGAE